MAKWKRVRSYSYSEAQKAKRSSLYGPLRVARLCVLSIIVPGLLLSIPLYMRYNVYIQQAYPVGMSDVRMLDNRISTTWCQRQVVWSNATFNAYLMPEQPEMQPEMVKVAMTRHLVLEDDMKEYWGFYLLKGSTVTVSTCVRWPGASLIMIRGHKHLKECAYIGDDSSEELDEIFEGDGNNSVSADYDISNKPTSMKKVSEGILIEDKNEDHIDISSQVHHHKPTAVEEAIKNNLKVDNKKDQNVHLVYAEQLINPKKIKDKEEYKVNPMVVNIPVPTTQKPKTSAEIYNDMLVQLKKMGPKGKTMLDKLNKNMNEEIKTTLNMTEKGNVTESSVSKEKPSGTETVLDKLIKINPAANKNDLKNKKRRRREIPTPEKTISQLTRHDEGADHAAEEEVEHWPDGVAEIRGQFNQTTANDTSKSEYWSSFSSSEEKLLECEGLLLNLPLTPHTVCEAHRSDNVLNKASSINTVSYKVPSNGYYFFVFNSENEVQPNFLHINFRLEKTTYNVSNAVASCRNQTGSCSLPLRFFSTDKVILELPVKTNDTLWNEEFLAVSTCEPRTALYVICVLAVPLLIILFAFQ